MLSMGEKKLYLYVNALSMCSLCFPFRIEFMYHLGIESIKLKLWQVANTFQQRFKSTRIRRLATQLNVLSSML